MAEDQTVGYLKVNGVEGECEDTGFSGQVKVVSWHLGGKSASTVAQTGGSSGAGKPQHNPLQVTVYLDSGGPEFWDMVNTGSHKNSLTLTVTRLGQGKKALVVSLTQVYCAAYTFSHADPGSLPQVSLTFTYGKIELEYFKQLSGGSTVSTGEKSYDARTNTAS